MALPVQKIPPLGTAGIALVPGSFVGNTTFKWYQPLPARDGVQRWSVQGTDGQQHLCEIFQPEDDTLLLALATNCVIGDRRTSNRALVNILYCGWLKGGEYCQILDLEPDETEWLLLDDQPRMMEPTEFLSNAVGFAAGLKHMHKCELLHTAISADCVRQDQHGLRLADFFWRRDLAGNTFDEGLLQFYPQELSHHSLLCMAPEVVAGALPSREADVYSLGCVFFWWLTGEYPRQLTDVRQGHYDTKELVTAPIKPLQELRKDLPRAAIQAIMIMLHRQAENRNIFGVEDLLNTASIGRV